MTELFCQTRIAPMKISLLTSLMIAGLTMTAFGASADADLKALEQQWLDAYVKADTAFVKTVEADDWSFVDSDGKVMNKAQDIKELGDKTFVCKSASMSEIKIRMLGDNHAVATGLVKMAGTYKGKDFASDFRALDLFEKKGDKWQAIVSQITKVEKEKE